MESKFALENTSWLKGFVLSTASALVLSGSLVALADEAEEAQEDRRLDTVSVVGSPILDSLAASLAIQREADNIVNAIASDTLGQFPDATAAGALARLPGIGVQRDQGQERYIQVRGAPSRWTTVALDGINVLGAEDRIFRFDSVPAVQIDSLELNKTLLASMPAESLAGNVNIKTYSPINGPEGFSGTYDFGYGFGDLGDAPIKQYAGRLSWNNGKIAATASASHYSFEQHTDNSEPRFDDTTISQLRVTKYVIERQTESYSGKVQYSPNDQHLFELSHLYTEFNDFEERNQYRWEFGSRIREPGPSSRNRAAWDQNPTVGPNGEALPANGFDTAAFVGVPVVAAWEEGIYSNSVKHTRFGGEHTFDEWEANWALGYTETEFNRGTFPFLTSSTANERNTPIAEEDILATHSIIVDVNAEARGIPTLQLYETVSDGEGGYTFGDRVTGINPFNYNTTRVLNFVRHNETEAWTVKGDVKKEFEAFGADNTFSAGLQYDTREQESFGFSSLVGGTTMEALAAEFGLDWNIADYYGNRTWDTNFPYGYSANYINSEALFNFYDEVDRAYTAANGQSFIQPGVVDTVEEDVLAVYLQNKFDWGRHSVTAGLRIEKTEIDTNGLLVTEGETTVTEPINVSSDETEFFPNIYYKFDYTDDIVLRAGFVSGQARPSLSDMRAAASFSPADDAVSGGNPFLVPEKAYGVDLSAEWYFAPEALLAASFYHREIRDTLFDSSVVIDGAPYGAEGPVELNSWRNGGDGQFSGVEFTYYHPFTFLPDFWSGFGVQASAAFVEGEFDAVQTELVDGVPVTETFSAEFDGTSDTVLNGVLFYEKYGFSGRVTYQWRSDWLDNPFASGSSSNSGRFWDETERVDASARYAFNENFSIYMDATNLFDERGVRYQGQEDRPYEVEGFGRRFLFGIRGNF